MYLQNKDKFKFSSNYPWLVNEEYKLLNYDKHLHMLKHELWQLQEVLQRQQSMHVMHLNRVETFSRGSELTPKQIFPSHH